MSDFEQEVRAHLAHMVKRPLTAAEQALLERALKERRIAAELVAAAGLVH